MDFSGLTEVENVINLIFFPVAMVLVAAYFVRFKFKTDFAALLIMITYLVIMFARIFSKPMDFGFFGSILPVGNIFLLGVLNYFVFEMGFI
jgi:CBS domain containing-hemolysin-like protein